MMELVFLFIFTVVVQPVIYVAAAFVGLLLAAYLVLTLADVVLMVLEDISYSMNRNQK